MVKSSKQVRYFQPMLESDGTGKGRRKLAVG